METLRSTGKSLASKHLVVFLYWLFLLFFLILPGSSVVSSESADNTSSCDAPTTLRVATCQFPLSADIQQNANYVKKFIQEAATKGSDIIHFSEAALCGYPGNHFDSFDSFDWQTLRKETRQIIKMAQENNIWVILGSSHYIDEKTSPTNCLYIISGEGKIVERYDKSMLAGQPGQGDLKYYTAGNHRAIITIKGMKCGFAICADSCYPPLYNEYKHNGVRVMFNSFYNAGLSKPIDNDEYVPAIIRARAFDYSMWMIACNASTPRQSWPTCIACPRGIFVAKLQKDMPGILYYDIPQTTSDHNSFTSLIPLPAQPIYHRGQTSSHNRILNTQSLP